MDEHGAEADGGAVHEHELARRAHAAHLAQLAEHILRHVAAEAFGHALGEAARPVVHQRAVEEGGPAVQHRDHLAAETGKTPVLVGRHGARLVIAHECAIEFDRAAHEARREDAHAAEVHQVHRTVGPHGVVAEMRVAMDDTVAVERHIPGAEHVDGERILLFLGTGLPVEQWFALQPSHGEQSVGRMRRHDLGHMHIGFFAQHVAIEADVLGFATIVQFLAQPRRDFGMDLVGADRRIETLADCEHELQLIEISLQRRGHVGILQLARHVAAVRQHRAMDLPQRGGERRFLVEFGELGLPVRAQFRGHAAAHEGPAHGRRIGLELRQLARIFGRQGVGNGGEQLGGLHQRPLQAAKGCLQLAGMLVAVQRETEIALPRQLYGEAADRRSDPGVAPEPAAERITLVFLHARIIDCFCCI